MDRRKLKTSNPCHLLAMPPCGQLLVCEYVTAQGMRMCCVRMGVPVAMAVAALDCFLSSFFLFYFFMFLQVVGAGDSHHLIGAYNFK